MSTPDLTAVTGVGDAYADELHEVGIATPGELANSDVDALTDSVNIPHGRLETIIENAVEHQHTTEHTNTEDEDGGTDIVPRNTTDTVEHVDEDAEQPTNTSIVPADHVTQEDNDTETHADADLAHALHTATTNAETIQETVDQNTVNTRLNPDAEDTFFTTIDGDTTVVNRYDLEKTVPDEHKPHLREIERYWVNKPYAFVVVFYHTTEHEHKYYAVEPYLNEHERDTREFLRDRLRETIRYIDTPEEDETRFDRADLIQDYALSILEQYDRNPFNNTTNNTNEDNEPTVDEPDAETSKITAFTNTIRNALPYANTNTNEPDVDPAVEAAAENIDTTTNTSENEDANEPDLSLYRTNPRVSDPARPEPAVLNDNPEHITPHQLDKILYYLKRDFIGYGPIDPVKHDINIEDISADGYDIPIFVYHTEYEQIISNIKHETDEALDDFVVKLAQRSGKGISKREPQVDATLVDGSRAQLTLGTEVSGHGTNYTIRQFKDIPFTPVDLANWGTMSLNQLAFLWLAIENDQSMIVAGGTASGKTTTLNAISLFVPSNQKIVSIEDTRELELPQRNWVSSVTRDSFAEGETSDVDEFSLLESALRQRPDYIIMGEVRGEEGRTLFQVMSTGHTSYTTFHADNVDEVIKRFTSDPINVSKTMFTTLNMVAVQTQTRVNGNKVRRVKTISEIAEYEPDTDSLAINDVYEWDINTDTHNYESASNTLKNIQELRGWSQDKINAELLKRKTVLAYLIKHNFNTYGNVAATIQGYLHNQDFILSLIATDRLGEHLSGLREIESVAIDIDEEQEALVPRPDPIQSTLENAEQTLDKAHDTVLDEYTGTDPEDFIDNNDDLEQ